jgi:hypothetical protein
MRFAIHPGYISIFRIEGASLPGDGTRRVRKDLLTRGSETDGVIYQLIRPKIAVVGIGRRESYDRIWVTTV